MEMDGSVLEENTFKSWSYLPLLNWIGALIVKTVSEKTGALIHFMKFFSPEVALYIYHTTLQGVLFTVLVLLAATWKCYRSFRNV